MSADYAGAPPPASTLGAWLLKQVQDLAETVRDLVTSQAEGGEKTKELIESVNSLKAAIERSSKIQDAQGIELAEIKLRLGQANKQLNGLRISRGKHKAKAQKLVTQMEARLN